MPQRFSPAPRTWGTRFDSLDSMTPPTSSSLNTEPPTQDGLITDAPAKKRDDKMPHDASVFVGSLPANMDQAELTRLLSEHLCEHAEVKNIKVIRDSKGGVCAFVQCEDASSAATLIHTLQSSAQRPFLGRLLRYEPARAFRTLLISYRIPTRLVSDTGTDLTATPDGIKRGRSVELDLPFAMKVWRPRNAKFYSILYNAEARDSMMRSSNFDGQFTGGDTYSNSGLYLDPVAFDSETIRRIAGHFGPLEHCVVYRPTQAKFNAESDDSELKPSENWKSYPVPHNALRNARMDNTCLEVKWEHRDDCISALMTLRRVPHLTVTWAHYDQNPSHQGQRFSATNVAPYPLHVQDHNYQGPPRDGHPASPLSGSFPHMPPPPTASPDDDIGSNIHSPLVPAPSGGAFLQNMIAHSASAPEFPTIEQRDGLWGPSGISDRVSPRSVRIEPPSQGREDMSRLRASWSEMDFPPLGNMKEGRKADYGVWGDKVSSEGNVETQSTSSPVSRVSTPRAASDTLPSNTATGEDLKVSYRDEAQELDMPDTPGLGMSPITPKTPSQMFPATPTGYNEDFQALAHFHSYDAKENAGQYAEANAGRELDPTTIFVGGLEMYGPDAWDEEKVERFFSRFGKIEHVKVVRPVNSRSAFAFVKFDNKESPARAVIEEHNSLHDGRHMRVQLRDCNPPYRGNWKHVRGRGKYHHHGTPRHYQESVDAVNAAEARDLLLHQRRLSYDVDGGYHLEFPNISNATSAYAMAEAKELHRLEASDRNTADSSGDDAHAREDGSNQRNELDSHHLSDSPDTPSGSSSQPGLYRDWYAEPMSAARTPAPSSLGSSASATAPASIPTMPYPMMGAGYYPQPWMQPFAPQFPYQMPYFTGYPGFTVPPALNVLPANTGSSDASGTPSPQNAWPPVGGVYNSYVPYPGYAFKPAADASQAQQPQQPQTAEQPPLVPTGFLQNDHGALVAVYHPEALDQYMSTAQHGQGVSAPSTAQNMQTWAPYPVPQPYPVPVPTVPMMGYPPRQFPAPGQPQAGGAGASWIPGQMPLGFGPAYNMPPHAYPGDGQGPIPNAAHPMRVGYEGDANAQFKRQQRPGNRRDQPGMYSGNRNYQSRLHANRFQRGGMSPQAFQAHGDVRLQPAPNRPVRFNATAGGESNQWNADQ